MKSSKGVNMEKIIEIDNLTKSHGKFKAVDDLSMYVEKGKIFGLLGPNGSGKSTTINCILSLLNFEKGVISLFKDDRQLDETKKIPITENIKSEGIIISAQTTRPLNAPKLTLFEFINKSMSITAKRVQSVKFLIFCHK